jgi:GDP-4-dehydro-6-deoxy-D-mannose reductase
MTKKVLVTGYSGFVGSHLVSLLLDEGYVVIGLSNNGNQNIKHENFTPVSCDITNKSKVEEVVNKYAPQHIYHLAGLAKPNTDQTQEFYDVNFYGALNVLEAAKKSGSKVLLISTAYVYGTSKASITENHNLGPVNHYGVSKAASELLGNTYSLEGQEVVVARPFNHTGVGQITSYLVPSLLKQIHDINAGLTEPIIQLGNLDSVRDFTDVRDVVKAYVLLMNKGVSGEVYNISSGKGTSVQELFDLVCELANKPLKLEVKNFLKRKTDISYLVGNPSKINEQIGWYPEIPFAQTLKDILGSF